MKKKSLILMFALAGLIVSCNDAIDIEQPGDRTEASEVFTNYSDIQRGVSGIYALIPGESEVEFNSVFTDAVALGIANGGQGLISGEYGFLLEPGTDFAISTWGRYYSMINRINRILGSTEELIQNNPSAEALPNLNRSKVELLVLRAYSNLKLFAYYTPDYTNPSGPSIMKLDFVPDGDFSKVIGRSTVAEIKDFILQDLNEAQDLINSGVISNFGDNIYVTPALIPALKTKLYSYVGDYSNVVLSGKETLLNPGTQISQATAYETYFSGATIPSEIIFQLKRVRGNASVAEAWYSRSVSLRGQAFYEMGRSLYNELDKLDPNSTGKGFKEIITIGDNDVEVDVVRNDVRFKVNVQGESKIALNYESLPQAQYVENDVLLIGKYPGKPNESLPLQNNIPIMRSADIYLTIAEARAAEGKIVSNATTNQALYADGQNLETVEGILYFIRVNRSYTRNTAVHVPVSTPQSAWKAILEERRVEFAFEGHRYLDMKRLGAKAGSPGFQRYSKDALINGTQAGLPVTDHRMTLPIPTTELNSNSIIRGQQNPGY